MTKLILVSIILLSFTACQERKAPQPKTPKYTEEVVTYRLSNMQEAPSPSVTEKPIQTNSENTVPVEIPVLEDELPVLPTPVGIEETTDTPQPKYSTNSIRTDGLDMGTMRASHSPEKTRIVFDSYAQTGSKVAASGHYSYTYVPSEHRIILIVNGYRKFSALGSERMRTFSTSSIVKKVYLDKMMDDSAFKCIIDLRSDANVNVFDIKEPGRIVVDITPS